VIGRDHASADLREALADAQHEFNVAGSLDIQNSAGFSATEVSKLQSLISPHNIEFVLRVSQRFTQVG